MANELSVLVITEDSARNAHSVICKLVKKLMSEVAQGAQTNLIHFEPPGIELGKCVIHANRWSSAAAEHQEANIALRRAIATKLAQKNGVVVFHFDGDVAWSNRSQSSTCDQFSRLIVDRVMLLLRNAGVVDLSERAERLVPMVPFYSIEAWLFQNTDKLLNLCQKMCRGAHSATYQEWAEAPELLDEIEKIKTKACVAGKYNLDLCEDNFPWSKLTAADKSFQAVARQIRSRVFLVQTIREALTPWAATSE